MMMAGMLSDGINNWAIMKGKDEYTDNYSMRIIMMAQHIQIV